MARTDIVFMISETENGYDIKTKGLSFYNRYNVPKDKLFDTMTELADIFNNDVKVGISFCVE